MLKKLTRISVKEAAALLSLSELSLRKAIEQNKMPFAWALESNKGGRMEYVIFREHLDMYITGLHILLGNPEIAENSPRQLYMALNVFGEEIADEKRNKLKKLLAEIGEDLSKKN